MPVINLFSHMSMLYCHQNCTTPLCGYQPSHPLRHWHGSHINIICSRRRQIHPNCLYPDHRQQLTALALFPLVLGSLSFILYAGLHLLEYPSMEPQSNIYRPSYFKFDTRRAVDWSAVSRFFLQYKVLQMFPVLTLSCLPNASVGSKYTYPCPFMNWERGKVFFKKNVERRAVSRQFRINVITTPVYLSNHGNNCLMQEQFRRK